MLGRARRKPRLAPAQRVQAGADPVAAATEDKAKRIWEAIQAVARTAPATVSTILFDTTAPRAGYKTATPPPFHPAAIAAKPMSAADTSPAPPAAIAAPAAANAGDAPADNSAVQEEHNDANAGLGALLGYEEEDGDDSPRHAAAHSSTTTSMGAGGTPGDNDSLDKELALFMQQLESDGLLNNAATADHASEPVLSTVTPAESTDYSTSTGQQGPAANQGGTDQSSSLMDYEQQQQQQQQQESSAVFEGGHDASADQLAGDANGTEAEQQVLGYLRAAPAWCKCIDGPSGQAYYWNTKTNEVVWEVPEGLDADDLIPAEAEEVDAEADAGEKDQAGRVVTGSGQAATDTNGGGVVSPAAEASNVAAVSLSAGTAAAAAAAASTGTAAADGVTADGAITHQPATQQEGAVTDQAIDLGTLREQLQALLQSARTSAQYFLSSMPRIVRVAIEAEVRLSDMDALSQLQQTSHKAADTSAAEAAGTGGVSWQQYQQHVQGAVKALESQLLAAEQEATLVQEHARMRYPPAASLQHPTDAASGMPGREGTPAEGGVSSSDAEDGEVPVDAAAATAGQAAAQASDAAPTTSTTSAVAPSRRAGQRSRRRQSPDGWRRDVDDRWPHDLWHEGLHSHPSPPRRRGSPTPYHYRPHPHPLDAHAYSWADHYAYHHAYHAYDRYAAAYYGRDPHGYPAGHASALYPAAYHPSSVAPLPSDDPEAPSPPPPPDTDTLSAPPPPGVASPDSPPPPLPSTPHGSQPAAFPPPLPSPLPAPAPAPAPNPASGVDDEGGSTSDMETEDMGADGTAPSILHSETAATAAAAAAVPVHASLSMASGAPALPQEEAATAKPATVRRREYWAQPSLRAAVQAPAVASVLVDDDGIRRSLSPSPLADLPAGTSQTGAPTAAAAQDKKRKHGSAAAAAASASSKKPKVEGGKRAADGGKKAGESGIKLGSRKVGALVSQWMSVQKQLEAEQQQEEQAEAEVFDAEAQERKRLQEVERWRQQQATVTAEDNANFAPVQGDWRKALAKLDAQAAGAGAASTTTDPAAAAPKEVKEKSTKEKDKSSSSKKSSKSSKEKPPKGSSSKGAAGSTSEDGMKYKDGWLVSSKTRPDLDQLSKGLPVGWRAMWDKATGDIYYGNPDTKEVSWSRP